MAKIKQFGETWWGRAWLDALEQRALVDPNRLPRGRTYARKGLVLDPELEPGLLSALVQGTEVYTTSLGVRRLTDVEWDAVLDGVVTQAKQAAALLAGEVPQELQDVLLPDAGDLAPDCSCPDWAEPCKHAAALCYVAADLLDADPFALLLLRGRGRDQVLAQLRRRRAAALGVGEIDGSLSLRPRGADPGVNAADAYRRWRSLATDTASADDGVAVDLSSGGPSGGSPVVLPSLPVPVRARTLPRLSVAPPADSGIDETELQELVGDAARRAVAMLSGDGDSGLGLSVGADVARRAITGDVASIAEATDLARDELAAAARAFLHGGPAGMAVARRRWDATAQQLQPGVVALTGRAVVTRANTVSAGSVQLRLDDQGTWWRFDTDDTLGWVLAGPGATDPAELV